MQTVLHFFGLFLLLLLSFIGCNYLLSGDVIISGIVSLILVIIVFFLIDFLKKRKLQILKNKFSMVSILMWVLFSVLSIPIGLLVFHALNVELNAKNDLKAYSKSIVNKNQEMINLFKSENQQYVTETFLIARNALDAYVNTTTQIHKDSIQMALAESRFGITDLSNITKANFSTRATALQSALEIRSNALLDSVMDRTKSVVNSNLHLVNNWSRLRVVNAIAELELMLEKNINQMNNFLKNENFKPDTFVNNTHVNDKILIIQVNENNQLNITKSSIQLASIEGLWSTYKPYWLFIPVFFFFFLLLIPYLMEKTVGLYIRENDNEKPDNGGIEI